MVWPCSVISCVTLSMISNCPSSLPRGSTINFSDVMCLKPEHNITIQSGCTERFVNYTQVSTSKSNAVCVCWIFAFSFQQHISLKLAFTVKKSAKLKTYSLAHFCTQGILQPGKQQHQSMFWLWMNTGRKRSMVSIHSTQTKSHRHIL